MFKLFTLTISLLIGFAGKAFALTELTANVDRNPVMVNESFILQIVADDSIDANELDLAPILRSGLTVGRTSTSSQTQIINGSISKTTTLSTVLLAREEGEYTIPSLTLDGVKTQPITVNVIKTQAGTDQGHQSIFLKSSIEQSELYLQQTVKLITKLYFAPNVDLQSGTLSDPALESAIIKQQGKDTESSEIIMGMRYRVIERVYTLTPQESGDFVVTSPTFNGEVSTDRRRSVFSSFGSRKPVSSIGNDIEIKVSPIPSEYQGSWLPSDLVQLNDEWQPNQLNYQVGEPITRTFTLTALNVNEEQLPELKGQYPSSFNVYPDQSESHSVLRQNAIVSQRVSSEAIVATVPGTYTLPEVSINWFNTKTRQVEKATIPARKVEVIAAENEAESSLVTNVPLQQQDISAHACPTPETEEMSCPALFQGENNNWLLIAISGWVAWFITLIFWLLTRSKTKSVETPVQQQTAKFDITHLKRACKSDNPQLTRAELIKWGQENIDANIISLSDLSKQVKSELALEIAKLNQSQYSKEKSNWSGADLWKLVVKYKGATQAQKGKALPPLN